ncbi:ribose-phosphate pyrophosphokinase [Duganella sp. 1411]|uniref:ribose-phosphate diphosphokinase n=1 Tax=Duganella sp. 1411 TaxID=2806572 RepID=UPI001AE80E7C|nr:ribose-phosphate diphosphokinase [Duganella sp. 1411]MBP1205525.1 ribose-phosphate pyrophosphokinase [Duganella sp. 1411]
MLTITSMHNEGSRREVTLEPRVFTFAGGESQVVLPDAFIAEAGSVASVRINAWLRTADAVMQLLLLTDAVRRVMPNVPLHLNMPYVPYARQDRVCNPGEALSAKVFCNLINAQAYASVVIADPHSDVVPALLDRVSVVDAAVMLAEVLRQPAFARGVTLLAPDAGARKRVQQLAKKLDVEHIAFADKVRDTKTGRISGTSVSSDLPHLPILVVDDICDGGRTFVELGKALAEVSSQPRYLYVTHGIFSKGFEELNLYYQRIFTAYNWNQSSLNDKLTTITQGALV